MNILQHGLGDGNVVASQLSPPLTYKGVQGSMFRVQRFNSLWTLNIEPRTLNSSPSQLALKGSPLDRCHK